MSEFTKGQRVTMTELAYRNGLRRRDKEPATGVVAHQPRWADFVSVVIDGQKTPAIYHVDFWQPTEAAVPSALRSTGEPAYKQNEASE